MGMFSDETHELREDVRALWKENQQLRQALFKIQELGLERVWSQESGWQPRAKWAADLAATALLESGGK